MVNVQRILTALATDHIVLVTNVNRSDPTSLANFGLLVACIYAHHPSFTLHTAPPNSEHDGVFIAVPEFFDEHPYGISFNNSDPHNSQYDLN